VIEPRVQSDGPYERTSGGLDFVAIDVETANSFRSSICAIGLAIVEDGRIVERVTWLVKPSAPNDHFDGLNVYLHGITPEAVADAPGFAEVLPSLLAYVDGRPVIAHNAAFDIGAIREGCVASGLPWPSFTYACSLVLSRRSLDLLSYRLPLVCDHLGILLDQHHDAGCDAEAAARIIMSLADRAGASSLEDLASGLCVRLGTLTAFDWAGCVGRHVGPWARPAPPVANPDADPDHPLYHAEIVFTGGLSIVRKEAWALVAAVGAIPAAGVTKETRFLVIGDGFAGKTPEEFHTGKATKVAKYRAKGIPIEVLTEGDLWQILDDTLTTST
jgi:DNA polymerase-3 subunit epsilon